MRTPWIRAGIAGIVLAFLAGAAWIWYSRWEPRQRARDLQEDLQGQRLSAESCRMDLSTDEASFRSLDETVDSLRGRVEGYESLHPEGVPADSFQTYLEVFEEYNRSVARWEKEASDLEAEWVQCSELVEEHNRMADSLRSILVEIGTLDESDAVPAPLEPTGSS